MEQRYKTAMGLAGFVVIGLLPSAVDIWEEKDNQRRLMFVGAYGIALIMIYYGVLKP